MGRCRMTAMELQDTENLVAESSNGERVDLPARIFGGGGLTFAAFVVVAALIMAFAFKTVHSRPGTQLESDPGAKRSCSTITYWNEHGYFASGGLMSFDNHLA